MRSAIQELKYDPFSADVREDPYPIYERLRNAAPAYHNAERGFWALSRFEDVQAAARDYRRFSNEPGVDLAGFAGFFGAGDFLDLDPPRHDVLRNVVRRAFSPRAVSASEPMVEDHAQQLMDALAEQNDVNIATEFALELPVRVVADLIGLPAGDRDEVFSHCRMVVDRPPGETEPDQAAWHSLASLRRYFSEVVSRSSLENGDASLSDIASAVRSGQMTLEEAAGMLVLLCVAGFETTASLLAHAVLLLALHPDQRKALVADRTLIPGAVEEILRYESPIQQLARTTTRDVPIHGTTIPRGERVALLYGSANRDERRFVDPDRFDIRRPKLRHLAFGEGIHHCLGAPLARLEGRVALAALLSRFPEYEVVGEVRRTQAPDSRGIAELPVRLRT